MMLSTCLALAACGGRQGPGAVDPFRPPFGGSKTEIVYSYQVKVQPPAGVPDWSSRKIASLPSVHFAELDAAGAVPADIVRLFAGKGGPDFIELMASGPTTYVSHPRRPGRYAFVKVVDPGQSDGSGLACVDNAGRPLHPAAVIELRPGATVYAGHIAMEIALRPSADPTVLEASFARLEVMAAAPSEDLKAMRVDPGSISRQPAALSGCVPWVFQNLVGRAEQCSQAGREPLDKRVEVLRKNRSIMQQIVLHSKLNLSRDTGPEQILHCPG